MAKHKSRRSKTSKGLMTKVMHTPLEQMTRHGKTLKSPLKRFSNVEWSSWCDDFLPNILWAALVTSVLPREDYLDVFRKIIINAMDNLKEREETYVTHNFLSLLADDSFDALMSPVLANDECKNGLAALRLIEALPDGHHWRRNLPEPNAEAGWASLKNAVALTIDHQSLAATDIRWLKVVYFAICRGSMHFQESMSDKVEELRLYPDYGDQAAVRPSIRAMEMIVRELELGKGGLPEKIDLPQFHAERFWVEMRGKTDCVRLRASSDLREPAPKELQQEILEVMKAVSIHFHETDLTTSVDARHDSTFGIVLYAINLLLGASLGRQHTFIEGRMALRSIMEALVTLAFLRKKDDDTIWMQYRNYGDGQIKLALLKNIENDDVPDVVNLALLDRLANEDAWVERLDIELGAWSNTNLRKMSEEAGLKDVYDGYYDWTSGYSHGHWGCVRDAVFVNCLNPLHRFHRIPGPPRIDFPTILPDGCRLVNRILDELAALYPTFKPRIKWHKGSSPHQAERGQVEGANDLG